MAMDQWGWTRQEAVQYLGITMAVSGIFGGLCFASIGPLAKRIDERKLLICLGLIPLIASRLVCVPMSSAYPPMYKNVTIGSKSSNA